jgi:hypothetical protein
MNEIVKYILPVMRRRQVDNELRDHTLSPNIRKILHFLFLPDSERQEQNRLCNSNPPVFYPWKESFGLLATERILNNISKELFPKQLLIFSLNSG